jgi:hypothetical protein
VTVTVDDVAGMIADLPEVTESERHGVFTIPHFDGYPRSWCS